MRRSARCRAANAHGCSSRASSRAPSNLLVLDEPTNDLDLETLDLLQEVIADYEGTVLIVSHDRDFLDRTVTVTLGLDGSGRVDIVAGGYADWERKRRPLHRRSGGPPPRSGEDRSTRSSPLGEGDQLKAGGGARRGKLTYRDQRELDMLPVEIDQLHADIERHEAAMDNPELYARDPDGFMKISGALDAARGRLAACEERWFELSEMAESLTQA